MLNPIFTVYGRKVVKLGSVFMLDGEDITEQEELAIKNYLEKEGFAQEGDLVLSALSFQ
jgi:hypothetical protein